MALGPIPSTSTPKQKLNGAFYRSEAAKEGGRYLLDRYTLGLDGTALARLVGGQQSEATENQPAPQQANISRVSFWITLLSIVTPIGMALMRRRFGPYRNHFGISLELAMGKRKIQGTRSMRSAELASHIGVSRSSITHWESGARQIPASQLPRLRSVLPTLPATGVPTPAELAQARLTTNVDYQVFMSLSDLSSSTGIPTSTLSVYFSGHRLPSRENCRKLEAALHLPELELLMQKRLAQYHFKKPSERRLREILFAELREVEYLQRGEKRGAALVGLRKLVDRWGNNPPHFTVAKVERLLQHRFRLKPLLPHIQYPSEAKGLAQVMGKEGREQVGEWFQARARAMGLGVQTSWAKRFGHLGITKFSAHHWFHGGIVDRKHQPIVAEAFGMDVTTLWARLITLAKAGTIKRLERIAKKALRRVRDYSFA